MKVGYEEGGEEGMGNDSPHVIMRSSSCWPEQKKCM